MSNFAPVPDSLTTQTVSNTASGIGASNIPGGAQYAEGYVRAQPLVETRDGTTPTTTKGIQWNAGDVIVLRSRPEILGFSAVRQNSTNATIDWQFWNRGVVGGPPGMRVAT